MVVPHYSLLLRTSVSQYKYLCLGTGITLIDFSLSLFDRTKSSTTRAPNPMESYSDEKQWETDAYPPVCTYTRNERVLRHGSFRIYEIMSMLFHNKYMVIVPETNFQCTLRSFYTFIISSINILYRIILSYYIISACSKYLYLMFSFHDVLEWGHFSFISCIVFKIILLNNPVVTVL